MYDSTKQQEETTSTGWDAANTQAGRNVAATGANTGNSEMKETLTQVKDQAKQALADTVDDVKAQANSRLAEQKQQAADRLGSIASALRTTGQDLQGQDEMVAQYVDSFADQIDKISGYIQNRDMSELLRDAQQLARRRPELFVAGALAAGFLVGRFFKSAPAASGGHYDADHYRTGPYNQAGAGQYGSGYQYGSEYSSGSRYGGGSQSGIDYGSPSSAAQPYGRQSGASGKTEPAETQATALASAEMESEGSYARP